MREQLVFKLDEVRQAMRAWSSDFASSESHPLRDKILHAYVDKTIAHLSGLLNSECSDEELVNQLKAFLAQNWQLINGTVLSYTAIPEHELTQLFCDIASAVGERTQAAPLALLMPSVSTDHISIPEKNLTTQTLKSLLKTHVLGRNGLYLVPVETLSNLELHADLLKIINAYYDLFNDAQSEDCVYLIPDELHRLSMHSPLAEAVLALKNQYDSLANDNSNLLGQLNELVRLMVYNSAHGGVGTAEIAGKGGMIAVAAFFEYLNQLTDEQKKTLPEAVATEVQLMRDYTVREEDRVNKNLPEIGSCLGTRSAEFKKAIAGNEEALSSICLSGEHKAHLLQEIIRKFESSKVALSADLQGKDTLGFTKNLLDALDIDFTIRTYDELSVFAQLSAAEITELCHMPNAPKTIVEAIGNIENLVILILELSSEKIRALLMGIRLELLKVIIVKPTDLSSLLSSFDTEKCRAVCESMQASLSSIIKSGHDFEYSLQFLSVKQRSVVFDAMQASFPSFIKSGIEFGSVLNYLSKEQRTIVFEDMQASLTSIIQSVCEFSAVIHYLSEKQRSVVIEKMKDSLSSFVLSGSELGIMLQYLSEAQCRVVIEVIKASLSRIITSSYEFGCALSHIQEAQCRVLCEVMQASLSSIIQSETDFRFLKYDLTDEKIAIVREAMTAQAGNSDAKKLRKNMSSLRAEHGSDESAPRSGSPNSGRHN